VRSAGLALLGLLLFGVYAATAGIPAAAGERYAGDEPHHLLAAQSFAADGDADLANQYAQRRWREFTPAAVHPSGEAVLGRVHEPQGLGVGLVTAPAYALGGARAVELEIAALVALGFVLAAALARRLVPDPWATGGVLLVALSPPALGAATTIGPEPIAGTLLAGATLCALRIREHARLRYAYGGALALALLPWLHANLALVGLPVGACLVSWTLAERRRLVALLASELMLGSLVFYARINETLYGGPTPASAALGGAAAREAPLGYADRLSNLGGLWLDRSEGLLRWAPALVLAGLGAWLLWRSRRERVAAVIPERREAERTAELLVATVAATWMVAALALPTLAGPWPAGERFAAALPALAALGAWGLRHARRWGVVLGALTLAASAWLLIEGDPWSPEASRGPWGPLRDAFPEFGGDPVWPAVLSAAIVLVLAALAAREWRASPRGATR
jgi:hypothetical protein